MFKSTHLVLNNMLK